MRGFAFNEVGDFKGIVMGVLIDLGLVENFIEECDGIISKGNRREFWVGGVNGGSRPLFFLVLRTGRNISYFPKVGLFLK